MILLHTLSKPVNVVYSCLSDMQKFAEVHPVIYKTEKLQRNEYLFYEKISFLYIPFSFSYKVELRETEENKLVYMYSKVQPGVYLELRFELNGTGNTTEVREEISIKAPLGIRQIFAGILKRAHLRFFDTIRSME